MINTIRQIKQGNSKAFKAIFDRYWNIVYRFTGLYLMDNYEKEEITQQVFIKLWEKRELLDEEKDLDGLLFIITRNLIFNHIRKKAKSRTDTRSILPAFTFSVLSDNIYN